MSTQLSNCPNCGAPIDGSGHCAYCGGSYKVERDYYLGETRVVTINAPRAQLLETRVCYPYDWIACLDPKEVTNLTLEQMRQNLAEALTGLLEIKVEDNLMRGEKVFRGRIRVIPPGTCFY